MPAGAATVLVLVLALTQWSTVESQLQPINCTALGSCSSCVAAPDSACIWCSTPVSAHCLAAISSSSCPGNDTVDPQSTITITPLPLDENNQVSVSTVHMKLRVGQPQTFTVSVRAADNFPLDLYMLMDLSASFESDLVTVKNIAPDIVSAVGNLTSRFQVGFGTFVDKATAPYNSLTALRLGFTDGDGQPSACANRINPCSRPFSYEHVVNLTNSTDTFDQSVQDLLISTSSDDPEGTLDAMMQAVVCTDVVGWREEARKVLLVMTDALMHTAGDGRLAGIYRPNDAKCHTQFDPTASRTLYSDSLVYDYPTIEQMRMTLEQFGVVPVFAASEAQEYLQNIAQTFSGFSVSLASDAANLIAVIEQAYNQLVNSSQLEFPPRDYLDIDISASCPDGSTPDNNGCSGIGNNDVNFTVTVTLNHCPSTPVREDIMVLVRPAFGTFTLAIDGHCACDCEQTSLVNSPSCSNNGNLTCGQCSCEDGWTGNDCSCSTAPCSTVPSLCSGRGHCECAKCVCNTPEVVPPGVINAMFFGDNCECNNFQCLIGLNSLICSHQGDCGCDGNCACRDSLVGIPYFGSACECDPAVCVNTSDKCIASGNCTVCNGNGDCNCMTLQCSCRETHTGMFCESEIPDTSCDMQNINIDCVLCRSQSNSTTACPNCDSYILNPSMAGPSTTNCSFTSALCSYSYQIDFLNGNMVVSVLPQSCFPIPIYGIAILIAAFLFFLGIIILIVIRIIILWYDRREYRRFKLESAKADLNKYQNPLYVSPETKYTNVAYKQ